MEGIVAFYQLEVDYGYTYDFHNYIECVFSRDMCGFYNSLECVFWQISCSICSNISYQSWFVAIANSLPVPNMGQICQCENGEDLADEKIASLGYRADSWMEKFDSI